MSCEQPAWLVWEAPKHVLEQGIPRGRQTSCPGVVCERCCCPGRAALHQTLRWQGRQGSRPLSISSGVVAFPPCNCWLLERRWSQVCAGWLPGEGCVLHILSSLGKLGRSGLRWPNTLPIPCWGCWAGSILPVQGMADIPLLIAPSCPLCSLPRCPASLGSHPGSKRSASVCPFITHLPALPLPPVPEQISALFWPPSSSHFPSLGFHPD